MPESTVGFIDAVNINSLFFRCLQKRLQSLGGVDRGNLETIMAAVGESLAGCGQVITISEGRPRLAKILLCF